MPLELPKQSTLHFFISSVLKNNEKCSWSLMGQFHNASLLNLSKTRKQVPLTKLHGRTQKAIVKHQIYKENSLNNHIKCVVMGGYPHSDGVGHTWQGFFRGFQLRHCSVVVFFLYLFCKSKAHILFILSKSYFEKFSNNLGHFSKANRL